MKYLSAKELDIDEATRRALIKVVEILPDIQPLDPAQRSNTRHRVEYSTPLLFDMDRGRAHYDCGTACCIGGLVALIKQGRLKKAQHVITITKSDADAIHDCLGNAHGELYTLFYPSLDTPEWLAITPAIAAQAVVNYLTTGDPKWSSLFT
jgi:hypothetical protein